MQLHVMHLVPPAAGGMRRHVQLLTRALEMAGCRISVSGLGRLAGTPDLVHAHGYRAALRSRLFRGPRVATGHNLPGRALGDRGAAWLAVSHAVAAGLRARGVPERRIRVIPAACVPGAVPDRDVCRRELGIDGRRRVVAFVGRLAPEKGLDVLLAATAHLPDDVLLLVAGDGPVRLPASPWIRRLGHVADPTPVYGAADVVCLPSRREGLGLAALEAMACARPVVASATGGIPEIVRHGRNGRLVPPGDPPALAMGLGSILSSPRERDRLGLAGRRDATAYTARRLAAAVLDAYAEALRRC